MSWRLRLAALAVVVVMVLVIVSFNSGPNDEASFAESGLLQVVGTVQSIFTSSARGIENLWREYLYLVGLREENRELQQAVDAMHGQVNELREDGLAARRLRQLLDFDVAHGLPTLGARVAAWDPEPWFKTMTIDVGRQQGVLPGMPVVSARGVVGRVVEASQGFSRVLLIIDYNSSVDAVVQRNRVRGILAGRSEKACRLRYVLKNDDVARGDVIVTSGRGGLFPPGLLLGTVTGVKKTGHDIFMDVDVSPAVNFDLLEEVLVVLSEPQPF